MSSKAIHPWSSVDGISNYIRLLKGRAYETLSDPLPRCQDIEREHFASGGASKDDLVLSVSHTWYYQRHPDPAGSKHKDLSALIKMASDAHKAKGETLIFIDFVSVPQQNFRSSQPSRTPFETEVFAGALKLFVPSYLMSDATIHLDHDFLHEPEICDSFTVTFDELRDAQLQLNTLSGEIEVTTSTDNLELGDLVLSVGGVKNPTMEDIQRMLDTARAGALGCCRISENSSAHIKRCPFGPRAKYLAGVKGWIYLERFVSMVKVAMVTEELGPSLVYSNNPEVVEEILKGGRELRNAALAGDQPLQEVLQVKRNEMAHKQFQGLSLDKLCNTGGVGGGPDVLPDHIVVGKEMDKLIEHLFKHWKAEQQIQQFRQLQLAVNRQDLETVNILLASAVDANRQDSLGMTCLHMAAKNMSPDIIRSLLEGRASPLLSDKMGNCAAHEIPLVTHDKVIECFELLALSPAELILLNHAMVTPLGRFGVYVTTEIGNSGKFPRALEWFKKADTLVNGNSVSPKINLRPSIIENDFYHIKTSRIETFSLEGRQVPVRVFGRRLSYFSVVCMSSFFVTPDAAEKATEHLAERVCKKYDVQVYALTPAAFDCDTLASMKSFQDFQNVVVELLNAMKLKCFILVDSTFGMLTPLLWSMKDRIAGALIVNIRSFHSTDFDSSSVCDRVRARFQPFVQWFQNRDALKIGSLYGDYVWAPDFDCMAKAQKEYTEDLQTAPDAFFSNGALYARLIATRTMEMTSFYEGLTEPLDFPIVQLVGAYSPAMWTHEAASRFHELVSTSRLEYIADSKSCWELEGELQRERVALVLRTIIEAAKSGEV